MSLHWWNHIDTACVGMDLTPWDVEGCQEELGLQGPIIGRCWKVWHRFHETHLAVERTLCLQVLWPETWFNQSYTLFSLLCSWCERQTWCCEVSKIRSAHHAHATPVVFMIHWDPQTYRKPGAIPTGCSMISPNFCPSDRFANLIVSPAWQKRWGRTSRRSYTSTLIIATFVTFVVNHRYKTSTKKEQAIQAQYRPVHLFFPPKTTSRSSATFIYFFIYFLNLRSKNSGPLALSGSQDESHPTPSAASLASGHRGQFGCLLFYIRHTTNHVESCLPDPDASESVKSWNLESSRTSMNKRNWIWRSFLVIFSCPKILVRLHFSAASWLQFGKFHQSK